MMSNWKNALCAGAVMTGLAMAAAAEPALETAEPYAEVIGDVEQSLDEMYHRMGPQTHDPEREAWLIRAEPRLAEIIDRLTVRYLADPAEQAVYARKIENGHFKGSAEDHARSTAVTWLNTSYWPMNAAVYDPDHTTNLDSILESWRTAEAAGHADPDRDVSCTAHWRARGSMVSLAAAFAEAVDAYLASASADVAVEAAFNPYGLSFLDAAGRESYLRGSITAWLMFPQDPAAHPPGCAATFTNFDAWAAWR